MSAAPLFFFILGAIVASFAGVIAGRLHTGQSSIFGRSRCDACTTPLSSLSLIPILSYIASRGRARCCGARLSPLSPISEALLATLFVLSYVKLGLSLALLFFLISLTLLLALVLYDLAHQILPPALLVSFVASAGITGFLLVPPSHYLSSLIGATLTGGALLLIHVLSRGRAMGFADAPLTFGLSLLTGPAALAGFIFSFWVGAGVGIIVLFARPAGSRMGVEVPFAPFLAAGFLLAFFTQWDPLTLIEALLPS